MGKYTESFKKEFETRGSQSGVDMSGADSLLGSIGRVKVPVAVSKDFIPTDSEGGILDLTGQDCDARWLGLDNKIMQYWAYQYCYPLSSVIDRLAEADTNGRIQLLNLDRTVKNNYRKNPALSRVMSLLKKPNPNQTWEEFNSEQIVLCKIFGYCPVFAVGSSVLDKTYTKYLFNLNPYYCTAVLNYDYDLFKPTEKVKEWMINILGKSYTIPSSAILLVKDGFTESLSPQTWLPTAKMVGLDFAISNICAAMEADNVLLKKKGPLGIFSHDPKPDALAGTLPLEPNEKKEIQDDLKQYGLTLGQLQYVISRKPLKWNAMSFNLRDLMTKETVRQGVDGICDRFGYPAELMSGKNATYENRDSAERFLYQNNIIPFSLRRMARYDAFFGLEDCFLNLDYNHLPVLQEDIVKAGEAYYAESQGLDLDWKNGIITFNQYLSKKQLPTIEKMDIYYPEWARINGVTVNENKNAPSQ